MTTPSPFERLSAINVNGHIEKKAGLSYLSWAWAVAELMKADPNANWQIHDPATYPDGTMMVACTVTAFGKPIYMWLPVMDHRNKAISNPNAFDINKNQMRCLVKAIACHGLGLYIYAGEDLPEEAKEETKEPVKHLTPVKAAMQSVSINEEDMDFLKGLAAELVQLVETEENPAEALKHLESQRLDSDQKLALWDILAPNSKTRNKIKAEQKARETALKGLAA